MGDSVFPVFNAWCRTALSGCTVEPWPRSDPSVFCPRLRVTLF